MKHHPSIFIFLVLSILTIYTKAEDPVVETKLGNIQGFSLTTFTGKEIDAYFGVPYAQPPLGELRFKKPKPVEPWSGTLEATSLPPICPQLWAAVWHETKKAIAEDCLYLTISVPKNRNGKLPVMVRFHGGGFEFGGSSLDWSNTTTLAAEENVIVVAMNYRLGVLGFLYLDTPSAPGNVGLWDQNLALKWVKENIESFGGDPDSITLFGESAGGASGNYHLLSTYSHPYFNRAILDSGVSTNPWAFMDPKKTLDLALKLVKNVGCDDKADKEDMVKCLHKIEYEKLIDETIKLKDKMPCTFLFVPTLDGEFIPDAPANLMSQGRYKDTDLLMGVTSHEGAMFISTFFYGWDIPDDALAELLTKKHFQVLASLYAPGGDRLLRDVIVHQYSNWTNPDTDVNLLNSMNILLGDVIFTCNIHDFADQAVKKGRTIYKYLFDFPQHSIILPTEHKLCLHAGQSLHVYGYYMNPKFNSDSESKSVSKKVMRLWANFARTG